ncbi:MmyB family transcriptional regulator [Streptomyces sp. enrichment culture]|uniref:MmyB family transcriptional regulator n=1 Tax=Streptomyces sp. enrichment culture TaxID=1795815 RepID=UPI003F551583
MVGNLRILTARNPGDPYLTALIAELASRSPEFVALWDARTVAPCGRDVHALAHPAVGELTVTQQTFDVPTEPHRSLVTFTAEPGSPPAAALTALHRTRDGRDPAQRVDVMRAPAYRVPPRPETDGRRRAPCGSHLSSAPFPAVPACLTSSDRERFEQQLHPGGIHDRSGHPHALRERRPPLRRSPRPAGRP